MFTGIIEGQGTVLDRGPSPDGAGQRFTVAHPFGATPAIGESIAVMGVCLTVVETDSTRFGADLSPTTLARTTLGRLSAGSPVNLERAATLSSRLGGHLVQGHVDGIGEVLSVAAEGEGRLMRIAVPRNAALFVVPRGSIAVDGVSLTVAECEASSVTLALVPHTLAVTTLRCLRAGDRVNLEIDIIAKYAARLLAPYTGQGPGLKEGAR